MSEPSISDEDMSEFEVCIDPVYAEPVKTAPAVAVEIAGQQGRYWMEAEGRWSNWVNITFNTWVPEPGVREVRNLYPLSAQVQDVAGWQTIETAPKDGSEILLYREDCGVILGRWISCSDFVSDGDPSAEFCQSDEEWEEPDWFGADFVSGFRITNDGLPTHWMPLPSPPASKNGDAE